MRYKFIGKNLLRKDSYSKVTGTAQYIADLNFPNLLHAKILRSPFPHAKIKSIKKENALSLDGVVAVITGEDCRIRYGVNITDQPPIATGKVRFVGEPVCVVVGQDKNVLDKATSLIEVEYEELPCVFDVYDAIKEDAPLVHEEINSNIYYHYRLRKGNIEKGFKEADLVVENEFFYPHISHTQLETHGGVARYTRDGSFEIYSSTQAPFVVRDIVSRMFKIDKSKIRVNVPYVGGGFGGKSDVTIEPLLAYISTFVPDYYVRLILTREEAFKGTVLGRGIRAKIKTGVKKNGKITAVEIKMYFNAGAYGDYCLPIAYGGGQNSPGPYTIPNIKVDSYAVYTNLPYVGAFRGYGHPEGNWITERQIDIIAEKLGIDPVKLRLINCWKEGDINHIGVKVKKHYGNLPLCIKKVAKSIEWDKWKRKEEGNKVISKSVVTFMKSPVMANNAASGAIVKLNEDGSVNLYVGTIDIGQGSMTALSQICAEKLGIPFEKISISPITDTYFSPYEWQTVASRGTWSVGNAVISACEDLIRRIKENASKVFNVPPSKIEYKNGKLFLKKNPNKKIDMKDIALGYMFKDGHVEGGPPVGYGYFMPNVKRPDPKTGQGDCVAEWTGGAVGIILSVDRDTGEIDIKKISIAIDAGKIVNPLLARGQLIGGLVQSLGQAIMEEIVYSEKGVMRNDSFTDYKVPSPEDVFDTCFDVIFVETLEETGPYGAKSLGEHGAIAVPAAVANAIKRGIGVNIFELPITKEKIVEGLKNGVL